MAKFEGLVSLTHVQVVEHRMTHKIGKQPVFVVVLENVAEKKEHICFYADNAGLYTQYPLESKLDLEVKTPQATLKEFMPEEDEAKSEEEKSK